MPIQTTVQHWIVKQEPSAYSWSDFVRDGKTTWTGVRNFQARNNLRAMRVGDSVLYYHSVVGKEIVGIARVTSEAEPDPTAREGDWVCVGLEPVAPLPFPVTLDECKAHPHLREILLVRHSRLSVIPLQKAEYEEIVALGRKPRKPATGRPAPSLSAERSRKKPGSRKLPSKGRSKPAV